MIPPGNIKIPPLIFISVLYFIICHESRSTSWGHNYGHINRSLRFLIRSAAATYYQDGHTHNSWCHANSESRNLKILFTSTNCGPSNVHGRIRVPLCVNDILWSVLVDCGPDGRNYRSQIQCVWNSWSLDWFGVKSRFLIFLRQRFFHLSPVRKIWNFFEDFRFPNPRYL